MSPIGRTCNRCLSDSWRDRTADSIAQAIDGYFATHVAGARTGAN
jgi:hypothetical protein